MASAAAAISVVPANGAGSGAAAAAGGSTAAPAAASTDSVQEQIRQLNDARKLVLANVSYYPTIVQGILPIINPSSLPQLRRWGADFLAEAFAAPALPSREKETLSLLVLESLKGMLENANEDVFVLRSIIQAAASIYPLVLRWIMNNSYDSPTWERMGAIKSRILRLWEASPPSVQICCVKFAQRVVLAQTHSANADQKRDGLDISLSLVPQNHPLLEPRHLEAEATGLLDRMLGVLQDNSSDALIVDATLNTLSILVRTRPTTVNRTINAVLNFNPLKLANDGPLTPRTRVLAKSLEKTTRMLLLHLTKRDPNNAFASRIQQYVERLMRSRAELLDDAVRKRALVDQQAAAYGDAKRQRLASGAAAPPQQLEIPPLGPGPVSLADIFTLTTNPQLRAFNAAQIPLELAAKISISTLVRVDQQLLDRAINGIRGRLATLDAAATQLSTLNPETTPLDVQDIAGIDDDDDYEPDFSAAEDAEQILNKLDNESPDQDVARMDAAAASLGLGAFKLPHAPPLTPEQAVKVGQATVARVVDMVLHAASDDGPGTGAPLPSSAATGAAGGAVVGNARTTGKVGLQRVAASSYDREAWLTILTRLATRSVSGLEDGGSDGDKAEADENGSGNESERAKKDESGKPVKAEGESSSSQALMVSPSAATAASALGSKPVLNDRIREVLFRYVLEDFRKRIDVAVAWLCEEWYNDQLQAQYEGHNGKDGTDGKGHYDEWVVRVLDGFLPYLHSQDNKVLTRFLGEVPALNRALLQRVKNLCRDPSMVPVALTSLLYQLMMRPPARALTLDTIQEAWVEFEDARPMATKYLDKWRPGFVQGHSAPPLSGTNSEGAEEGAAGAAVAVDQTAD
ncbi:mRNA cleavage and polyadenylation specificity factor complex subunit [Niveomyces insectorum RCEF 264]|uniref:mRNA cleavage and polyadenylation specificity factor complex subunit n=1 Tax=Niveomyces insectorum RCEF 264 TaxID=1081102 RepID=A0A167QS45_9HYPO|nr:mRNA cleavage and polyadenylation specificity factor complex subunit [Niveomyces insectorum RCEF 264]